MSSQQPNRRSQMRILGIVSASVGVVCLLVGVCGVVDSWWFGLRAEQAIATVVAVDHTGESSIDTLEFTVAGRAYRVQSQGPFGVGWGPSSGLKARVPVLYLPDDPNKARLADFTARFTMPLILLVLGSMFTPAGWLSCRDSKRLSNEELERFMDPFRNC